MSGIEHDYWDNNPFLKGAQMPKARSPSGDGEGLSTARKVLTSLDMIVLMVVWAVTVLGTFAAGWFLAIGPPC